jgi:hypothetical protein
MQTSVELSEAERNALEMLVQLGGSVLESHIRDKNERDFFGRVMPGLKVFKRLETRGFVFFTEEEPLDLPGDPMNGFTFTPEVYITDEGKSAIKPRETNREE